MECCIRQAVAFCNGASMSVAAEPAMIGRVVMDARHGPAPEHLPAADVNMWAPFFFWAS
jgi:hypothetical protein